MTGEVLHAGLVVAVVTVLLAPGVLAVLGRRDPAGVCLGVLGGALMTGVAALISVVTDTPTMPWYMVAVAATYVAAIFIRTRHRMPLDGWRASGDQWAFMGAAAMTLPAAAIALRAPVIGDARWIWFFHASWFADPSFVHSDLTLAHQFAHPDYPPFGASFGGLALLIGDQGNDWIPQIATALLAVSATVLVAIVVSRAMVDRRWRMVTGAATAMVLFGVVAPRSFDGYMDGLLAVLMALAVIMALGDHDAQVATIAIAAAAITKNEGLMYVVVILVPLYWFARRSIRLVLPGLALGLSWAVAIRLFVDTEPWVLANIAPWSTRFGERLGMIAEAVTVQPRLGIGIAIWVGAAIGVVAAGRWVASKTVLVGTAAAAFAAVGLVVVVYLASPYGIDADALDLAWHLRTSMPRVLLTPAAILAAGGLYVGADLVSALLEDGAREVGVPAEAAVGNSPPPSPGETAVG